MVAGRTVSVAPRWRSLRRRLRRGGERWDEVCGLGHVEAHDTHVSGHVPACVEACPAGLVVVDRRVARTWTGVHDDDRQVLGRTMSAAVIRCTSMRIAAPSTDCSAKASTATRSSSTRFSGTISPSFCPSSTTPRSNLPADSYRRVRPETPFGGQSPPGSRPLGTFWTPHRACGWTPRVGWLPLSLSRVSVSRRRLRARLFRG